MAFKENEFDFVFNLFTSFGYFKNQLENIEVLKGVAKNLKENGCFVLDFLNAEKVIKNLVATENKTIDGIDFELKRTFDGVNITKDIIVKDKNQTYNYQENVSAFSLANMQEMATKSGLQISDTFGDYDLNPFNVNSSDRLILVMRLKSSQ